MPIVSYLYCEQQNAHQCKESMLYQQMSIGFYPVVFTIYI